MESLQQSNALASTKQSLATEQHYSTGYIRCMDQLHTVLLSCSGTDKHMAPVLLNNLLQCLPQISPSPAPRVACSPQRPRAAPCWSPSPGPSWPGSHCP
ncbi:unnamed protein product [Eretmochelys imbricata]